MYNMSNKTYLQNLSVGDTVTRILGGAVTMQLKVTRVDEVNNLLECGPWTFSRNNGAEIDKDLNWDEESTGSMLIEPEEQC